MKKSISLLLVLVFAVTCLALVACGGGVADNTQYYDAITKTLKLTKSYEGKSFIADGIGAAKLESLTDGDTTRFLLIPSGESVTIRYHGVNTPESTGAVEKWGKSASAFVKSKLSIEGTQFVLEATGPRAEHDNYGQRYLGYVWYKNPGDADFKCMNLEVVENGYSDNNCVNTAKYPYYDYFKRANDFAKSIQLRLYSKLDDPLYSTDPVDITLKQWEDNRDEYYNEEFNSGAKVRFTAVLTNLEISESTTYMFTAVQFDEDGTKHSINVYAGYASGSGSKMELGHLYRIVGTIQKHGGVFQVSGIEYDPIYGKDRMDYSFPIQENYYLTFNNDVAYSSNYFSTLYTDVTVVSSSVENNKLTIVGTATRRGQSGLKGDPVTFTFIVPVEANFNNIFAEGARFAVRGYQYEKDSKVINVLEYSDIVIH